MTAWRARLAALRSAHPDAGSADSADSKPRATVMWPIGATGATGIGESGEREARPAAFLADPAAGVLAEPDPAEAAERAAVAAEAAGDLGVPLAPAEHRAALAGLLCAALGRPPAWADATSLPPPGAWCTCCGRHHRSGGRWWCEAGDRPGGWRCWTCHPPNHLPADAVREART